MCPLDGLILAVMLLSCICFGVGEALLFTLLAGSMGLGAHAATCMPAPGSDPMAPTCCGHDHAPVSARDSSIPAALTPEGRPGSRDYDPAYKPRFLECQGAPGLSIALRVSALIALLLLVLFTSLHFIDGTAGSHADHDHSADTDTEVVPCGGDVDDGHTHDDGHVVYRATV